MIIDKVKTLARFLPEQKKPEQEKVAFKRKNSMRKYTQRKNSFGPIGINNKKNIKIEIFRIQQNQSFKKTKKFKPK